MPIGRTMWNQRVKAPDGAEIALDVPVSAAENA